MTEFEDVLADAGRILKKYHLCDYCMGRLFSKRLCLKSNKLLGRRLKRGMVRTEKCYICSDIYPELDLLLGLMLESSSGYYFDTFATGTQIKPSIIDRDDHIRSKFKLQGTDGIKTDITRELSRRFAKKTGKTLDSLDSDVTLTINIKNKTCQIRSKPVMIQGRYTKTGRNFPQKQQPCGNCSGRGCQVCNMHGIVDFESVEGKISKMLFAKFGCTTIKFTWIGGEDSTSLILGNGRPFFARLQNPSKRYIKFPHRLYLGFVTLYGCRVIDNLPKMPIKFFSTIKIKISAEKPVTSSDLKKLKVALSQPIVVYEPSGKRSEKSILQVRYRKISGNKFVLVLDAEGGLPVKRFVEGDETSPSVGQILGVPCKCVRFDFMQVYQ